MRKDVVPYAILTICDDGNYGNRLQNYALAKILSYAADVNTIRMILRADSKTKYLLRVATLPMYSCKKMVGSVPVDSIEAKRERLQNYFTFSRRIPTGAYRLSVGGGFEIASRSSVPAKIIIGSDQVWNYRWLSVNELKLRLGMFASSTQLLSYAASIGVEDIDRDVREIFKAAWSRIPHISVREDRAAELVKEISGRDATVVLDPTLMLTGKQWEEVFTDFIPEGDCYILTYFLGHPSNEQESVIQFYAKTLGARIRRINDCRDCATYCAGPAEFVELISKAQYVFTDSYHACCFSILFNKPFKVFNRGGFDGKKDMNSRMKTLFRLFELEDCMSDEWTLLEFDWNRVNTLLARHRTKSRAWLENALGVDLGALGYV